MGPQETEGGEHSGGNIIKADLVSVISKVFRLGLTMLVNNTLPLQTAIFLEMIKIGKIL